MTAASDRDPRAPEAATEAPQGAAPADAPTRGLLLMLFASTSFVAMNAMTSSLGREGSMWQTAAFARASIGLVVALLIARARGASLRVGDRRVMWTRSLAGSTGMLCTFYALSHLPLADATALLNTTPLWTALLAYITLGESAGRSVVVALGLAVPAIALIQRPSLAVGNLAGLVAICAGVASAGAMVSLRRLSRETPEAVVVQFSAVATALMGGLLGVALVRHGPPAITPVAAAKLVGIGVTATMGQLAMTRAYALDRAARVGAAGWIQIALALVLDVGIGGRALPATSVLGIGLMVLAGTALTWGARREERARVASAAASLSATRASAEGAGRT